MGWFNLTDVERNDIIELGRGSWCDRDSRLENETGLLKLEYVAGENTNIYWFHLDYSEPTESRNYWAINLKDKVALTTEEVRDFLDFFPDINGVKNIITKS